MIQISVGAIFTALITLHYITFTEQFAALWNK